MHIELSSGDLVKSSSGKIFEILSLRNYGRGYLTVVLINRDTREDFEVEFCNFKTEYKLLTDFDVSKQYVEGMDEGIKEGYDSGYNKGFEDGKSRGITLGYNKRDYEKKNKCVVDSIVKSDSERKHSHYFKDVRHLDYVDIYQICKLFPVDDDSGAIVHARKKLLVAGGRGAGKDMIKDITEARDTLSRYLQIEGYE